MSAKNIELTALIGAINDRGFDVVKMDTEEQTGDRFRVQKGETGPVKTGRIQLLIEASPVNR